MKTLKKLAFILAVLCLPCQCAAYSPICEKDSRQIEYAEIFNHRWWNYYDRAIFFGNKGCFEEAIKDFEAAIREESEKEDQWMARIYGIDFMDYFPRRELGIVRYLKYKDVKPDVAIDELKNAENSLMKSINMTPTHRAKDYLDQTRRVRLQKEGTDTVPPTVNFEVYSPEDDDSPIDKGPVNDFSVIIKGIANSDQFVRHITVKVNKDKPIPIEIDVSAKEIKFETEIPVSPGKNTIEVVASDLIGGPDGSKKEIEVVEVEREAPIIGSNDKILDIYALDDSGLKSLKINGRDVNIEDRRNRLADKCPSPPCNIVEYAGPEDREKPYLDVMATDNAGNTRTARIDIYAMIRDRVDLLNLRAENGVSQMILSDGSGLPADSDFMGEKPFIEIENQPTEWYDEQFEVKGNIVGTPFVTAISVKGTQLNQTELSKESRKNCYFKRTVKLEKGINPIVIKAEAEGISIREEFEIEYKKPIAERLESRLRIWVGDFERNKEDTFPDFEGELVEAIRKDKQQRFQVERLTQKKLERDDWTGIDCILSGIINAWQQDDSVHIKFWLKNARADDYIIKNMDIYGSNNIPERNVAGLPKRMSAMLARKLPLVKGRVEIDGKNITVKINEEDKYKIRNIIRQDLPEEKTDISEKNRAIEDMLKKRMRFVVYPKNAKTGEMRGRDRILGEAGIVKCSVDGKGAMFVLKIDGKVDGGEIKGGYSVISN